MNAFALTAFALLVFAPARALAQAASTSFAVVIGSNRSPSVAVGGLRYADDDALANQRVLELLGVRTVVLTSPDADTRLQFPRSPSLPTATRANLRGAVRQLRTDIAAAKAQGQQTQLYFFFAGHGDQVAGRSFLQLDDAQYWPEDLAADLSALSAHQNHVLIDACYSAQFVSARGPGGRRIPIGTGFASGATVSHWPAGTGFLTSRSASGQTHEWVEFQAGIFSHEIRSGFLGAADVDLDARVTYRELAAFIERANAAIPNPKYRPQVVATPPQNNLDAALISLNDAPMQLRVHGAPAARLFVETETGIRWADLHPAVGQDVRLNLPMDLGPLFVMRAQPEAEFRFMPAAGHVRLEEATATPPRARARGAAHEAFAKLFALPFAQADATAYVAREPDPQQTSKRSAATRPLAVGATVLGAATAFLGAGVAISAYRLSDSAQHLNGVERQAVGDSVDRRNEWAAWLIGTGIAAAAVGSAWLWWLNHESMEGEP